MTANLKIVSAWENDSDDAGNPLLRGIPYPITNDALIRMIAHEPFRRGNLESEPGIVRRLPDVIQSVVIPTQASLSLARTLFDLLHNGYDRRDPRKPGVWASLHQPVEDITYGTAGPTFTDGLAIAGITGLGKSHLVSRVLSTIPQTIRHHHLGGRLVNVTQIVWIYMDMNTATGLEALLLELLEMIDQLLGTQEYRRQYSGSKIGVDKLINTVISSLRTHFCGMLVLDEVQRLNFGLKQASERVRNLMLKLLNAGIPVVLVGNPQGLEFKEKKGIASQLVRRLKANGYVRLDPADSPEDEDWKFLVRGLWPCQILEQRETPTQEYIELLYRLTGGFPKYLAHLLAYSQQRAVATGARQLSPSLIEQAARTSPLLNEMRPMINAFVMRNFMALRKYSDVDADYYQEKWQTSEAPQQNILSSATPSAPPLRKTSQEVLKQGQRVAKASMTRASNSVASTAAESALGAYYRDELEKMLNPA